MSDPVHEAVRSIGPLRMRRSGDRHEVALILSGELDLQSAAELARELAAIRCERPSRILLDLSRLDFMDSAGLALIIDAERAARDDGIGLRLRRGRPQVRRLFELTGVGARFTFAE